MFCYKITFCYVLLFDLFHYTGRTFCFLRITLEGILLFELHKDWLDTFGFTDNNAYQANCIFNWILFLFSEPWLNGKEPCDEKRKAQRASGWWFRWLWQRRLLWKVFLISVHNYVKSRESAAHLKLKLRYCFEYPCSYVVPKASVGHRDFRVKSKGHSAPKEGPKLSRVI